MGTSGLVKFIAMAKIIVGLLMAALIFAGCTPPPPPPPPIITYPSRIVTEDGATFLINELRLPGTFQELRLRRGTATMWVEPSLIQTISFSGPERDRYRLANIWFMDGHRLQAEVYVDVLLEGTAEGLYWNMPLSRVQLLQFGTQ
jgi:prepilin-type processing-associated H-X9-DG protein